MSRKHNAMAGRNVPSRAQAYPHQAQYAADPYAHAHASNAPMMANTYAYGGFDAWQANASALYAGSEWSLVGSQYVDGFEVAAMSFDTAEELLWCGSRSGRLTAIIPNSSAKYCSIQAHRESIVKLFPMDEGILSLASNEIKIFSRGGLRLGTLSSEQLYGIQDASMLYGQKTRIMLSGMTRETITELDLPTSSICHEIFTECGVASISKSHRFILAGCEDGFIRYYDPRTDSKIGQIFVRHAILQNIAARGDIVATSGFVPSYDGLIPDDQISFIETRMNRILYEFEFPGGSVSLKFHTTIPAVVMALGGQGNIQFIDTHGAQPIIQDDIMIGASGNEFPTAFSLSSTGQCIGVGSSSGAIQIVANQQDFLVNTFRLGLADLRNVAHQLTESQIKLDFHSPLSAIMLPKMQEPLLSDYVVERDTETPRKPPTLDPVLKSKMKQSDYIGYISNPRTFKRNQIFPTQPKDKITIISSDFAYRRKKQAHERPVTNHSSKPPRKYQYQEIKWTKLGIDGFDFSIYNKTPFGGLENTLPNHYTNALIQVLYFIPVIRQSMINHICNQEFCLACELGFLFHTLDGASSRNCQSRNFLRALSHLKEASQSGVVETFPHNTHLSYQRLIEQFNIFILGQLQKELRSSSSATEERLCANAEMRANDSLDRDVVYECFGHDLTADFTCKVCKETETLTMQQTAISLNYTPLLKENEKILTLEDLMNSSLSKKVSVKKSCSKCSTFQTSEQTWRLNHPPRIININCAIQSREEANIWSEGVCLGSNKQSDDEQCKLPWMSSRLRVRKQLSDAGGFLVERGDAESLSESPDVFSYELKAVVCYIIDAQKRDTSRHGHVVSYIKVPDCYISQEAGDCHKGWYLFNDFTICPVSEDEVMDFSCSWKIPCILMYHQTTFESQVTVPVPVTHINANPLLNPTSLSRHTETPLSFVPLQLAELPLEGTIVALDAEFVALSEEEVKLDKSGNSIVTKPRRQGLGRVSIVRASGPMAGVSLVDDFIHTSEEVVDYLTKFSGLKPGDLDPASSYRHITTLKTSYLKIRFLVDNGVKFIGHGLTQDFRILDIHVPPDQIIDTVEIFHLSHQRKLSLKFLAYILLGEVIQRETHDSIEDARTALLLYDKFCELKRDGVFEERLHQIYEAGREMNWQIPAHDLDEAAFTETNK